MAKNMNNDTIDFEPTLETLEEYFGHINPTPKMLQNAVKPDHERVCFGIQHGWSIERKQSKHKPLFFKYQKQWYKWCPNCRQYHPIEWFYRHKGYNVHYGWHNVCAITTRILALTAHPTDPVSINEILKWTDLSRIYKPLTQRATSGFRKVDADKTVFRRKKDEIRKYRGTDASQEPSSEPKVVKLTVPVQQEEVKPQKEQEPVAVKMSEESSKDLAQFGAECYNKVLKVMRRVMKSNDNSVDFDKLGLEIMRLSIDTQRELPGNVMAAVYRTINNKKVKQS